MKNPRYYIIQISLIVALGGFLMGFDASVISGVVKFIEPEFGLSKLQLGWAVSSLTLTATLSMLIAGPLSNRWGRKKVLFFAAFAYGLSAILSALAPTFTYLVLARMIGGLGVGASLIIAPMYIAEISPPKIRGTMVSFNQLNIVIGISAAFFSNYLIIRAGEYNSGWLSSLHLNELGWRWMLGVEVLPALFYFFALFTVPRSPRWLIMHNKTAEGLAILEKVGGAEPADSMLKSIKQSIQKDAMSQSIRWREIYHPALRTVLLIGVVLAILQQITGINAVFFYAPMIFEQSGLGLNAAFSQAVLVGFTNLVFTVLAMLFIDKIGRKLLLIIGVSGITLSMIVLSIGFNSATYQVNDEVLTFFPDQVNASMITALQEKTFSSEIEFKEELNDAFKIIPGSSEESAIIGKSIILNTALILTAIIAFVAFFAMSLGPVMWVLFSELFPNRSRAIAISFVGFINSMVSFIVQLAFPWELSRIGAAPTFLLFGIFGAMGLIFILFKIPETKGKSLEELQSFLIPVQKSSS